MSLHDWFYFVGIIFMVVFIILMISIGLIFFLIYQRVASLQKQVAHRMEALVEPAEIALNAGAMAAKTAASKVRDIFQKRKT